MHKLLLVLSLIISAVGAQAQVQPYTYQTIGGWDVIYDPETEGCLAMTEYMDGARFMIGFDGTRAKLGVDVVMTSTKWLWVTPDARYSVQVVFDNYPVWNVDAHGTEVDATRGFSSSWQSSAGDTVQFVGQLKNAGNMRWLYQGQVLGDFSLRNSKRAVNAALTCTSENLDRN